MFTSLFTFPSEFKMMLKERASGMYRLSAFYLARTASDVPMDMFIPTIFVIIIYWMAWLQPTAKAFFCNWLAVMLTQATAQVIGMTIVFLFFPLSVHACSVDRMVDRMVDRARFLFSSLHSSSQRDLAC